MISGTSLSSLWPAEEEEEEEGEEEEAEEEREDCAAGETRKLLLEGMAFASIVEAGSAALLSCMVLSPVDFE